MNTNVSTVSTVSRSPLYAGASRSWAGRIGRAIADVWRETQYANQRVIELQQPWLDPKRDNAGSDRWNAWPKP